MFSNTRSRLLLAGTTALVVSACLVGPAQATPGTNGPFAVTMHAKDENGRYLESQVWTMASDGGNLHQQFAALEEENRDAVWSPDGQWLAFHRGGLIVVSRTDGSASRVVAQEAYGRISWSPDGTRLVFGRGEDGGDWSIWMVNADGTDEHEVYRGRWAEGPTWSPRGDRIAFVQQDPGTVTGDPEVFTMRTDGTDVQQVTFNDDPIEDEHFDPVNDFQPAWSPNGEQLVVVSDRDAPRDCNNCPSDLYISDVDGGNVRRVGHEGNEYTPTWSPDGESIAFVTEPTPPFKRDDPVWFDRYDLATGAVTHLHRGDVNSSIDWGVEPGSVPLADLHSSVSVATPVDLVGATTTVTAEVVNDGPRGSRETAAVLRLPAGIAVTGTPDGCTGPPVVACELGTLAPGESRSVTLDVVLSEPGVGEISALATSVTPDPDVLDNRSVAEVASCSQLGTDGPDVLTGTDAVDVLCGGAGDDELTGGAGDDVLIGGPGDDVLAGGDGTDSTSYAVARRGVRVDLAAQQATGDGTDTLATVETGVGSPHADVLLGAAGSDRLFGLAGADRLDGRGSDDLVDGGSGTDVLVAAAGDDRVRGGTGSDTVTFSPGGHGITGDLSKRTVTGQGTDRLWFVENLRGTRARDVLTGSVVSNALDGLGGNDAMRDLGGNDRVTGGSGSDALDGGDGRDRLAGGTGRDRCDQRTGRGASISCES